MRYYKLQKCSSLLHKLHSVFYGMNTKLTIEHVVPQSYMKQSTANSKIPISDIHNMILYSRKLNIHRSNYSFVDEKEITNTGTNITYLDYLGNKIDLNAPYPTKQYAIKDSFFRTFCPMHQHRGQIARICGYMYTQYPDLENIITTKLIDPSLLLEWHETHPVSDYEKYKNDVIADHQNNRNMYIDEPSSLREDVFER